MLPLNVTLSYYKRKDIQEEIIMAAANKEVAVRYDDKFGNRPDVLKNPNDILELAKQKATSFHCSEELWSNPLQLNPNMKKNELDSLRIGWDLVLDIDCSFFEYSKIAADLVVKALKFCEINGISCKFSGNRGFHIGVPFESFPEMIGNEKTRDMFPNAARKIACYIKELIKKPLGDKIMQLEKNNFSRVMEKTKQDANKITYYEQNDLNDKVARLNVEPFLHIDTLLISSRHLYRMPYSLHEKSGLASIPINAAQILDFRKEDANPKNLKISKYMFLDRGNIVRGEAKKLIMQAFDFTSKMEKQTEFKIKREYTLKSAIPEEFFPPCIKLISNGLSDGRKRALFILINFLASLGWKYEDIENYLKEWNKRNKEPLRENYLLGQLRYHKSQKKKILPPNCNSNMHYIGIGVCKPDNLCSKIKNPVTYALRKSPFSQKYDKQTK
ncbi:hypothetical protein HYX01_02205 [Candidatus Woesearchaeota archaeon]|nr:hypothetical protein [Candidatus Woesearchaeota archaeon]